MDSRPTVRIRGSGEHAPQRESGAGHVGHGARVLSRVDGDGQGCSAKRSETLWLPTTHGMRSASHWAAAARLSRAGPRGFPGTAALDVAPLLGHGGAKVSTVLKRPPVALTGLYVLSRSSAASWREWAPSSAAAPRTAGASGRDSARSVGSSRSATEAPRGQRRQVPRPPERALRVRDVRVSPARTCLVPAFSQSEGGRCPRQRCPRQRC